jgi:hypothetical protein
MPVLLLIRFLAELGLLVGLSWGGWALGGGAPLSVVLAVLLPLAAGAVWGRWVAPRAGHRLADPARVVVELALFGVAVALLLGADPKPAAPSFGVGLGVAYLLSMPARRVELGPTRGS